MDTPSAKRSRFDLATLGLCLFVIPCAVGVFGQRAIFEVFGNGDFIPTGSPGQTVLDWWTGLGRHTIAGLLAAGVAFWRLRRLPWSLALGVASGVLAWLYLIAALIVFVLLGGDIVLR